MDKIHEKIIKSMRFLHDGKCEGMPKWSDVYKAGLLAFKDPSFDNIVFLSNLYNCLNDLYRGVLQGGMYVVSKNDKKREVTMRYYEYDMVTKKITNKDVVQSYNQDDSQLHNKQSYDRLFKGKKIDDLNEDNYRYETLKFEQYLKDSSKRTVEAWANRKDRIHERLHEKFGSIIDKDLPCMTFEDFINEYAPQDPGSGNEPNAGKTIESIIRIELERIRNRFTDKAAFEKAIAETIKFFTDNSHRAEEPIAETYKAKDDTIIAYKNIRVHTSRDNLIPENKRGYKKDTDYLEFIKSLYSMYADKTTEQLGRTMEKKN